MDVQGATATAPLPPSFSGVTSAPPSLPDGSAPAATDPNAGGSAPAAPTPPAATPAVGLLPPTGDTKGAAAQPPPPTLANDVAKLFSPASTNLSVSFRAASGSDQIVVVVTDKTTGQVVSQFPSETLIALAQFFNKLDGSVVDKKA